MSSFTDVFQDFSEFFSSVTVSVGSELCNSKILNDQLKLSVYP